ncbi:MAG: outer membrane beta-barrel protein [Planctomycetota bacterium]|nr:outer membrane beta-barrel protein [Planctomycetota bacterium]
MFHSLLKTTMAVATVLLLTSHATAAEPAATSAPAAPGPATPTLNIEPPAAATTPETPAAPAAWPPGLMMDGLKAIGIGKGMEDLGFRTWGFVEGGFTGRLSGGQKVLPGRLFDSLRPDNAHLQQLRLTIDRPYDATKNFDVGFRWDGLFGGDARFTRSVGMFPRTVNDTYDEYGDMPQFYIQTWTKTGAESGLEVTAGKFVTPMGAEVIDAVGNPLFSHSYLFDFAIPFTNTGVKVAYIVNPQLTLYVGTVEGWDVFEDPNRSWSEMAGAVLSSKEQIGGHARTTLAINVITGPEQVDNVSNYRTVTDLVLTHWWTENLSQTVNFDYGAEAGANATGSAAHWYGVAHYLTYVCNEYVSPTWRVEWFRDPDGVRTGVAANYYENTFGLAITPMPKDPVLKNLSVRPELRWDFTDRPVFGGGGDRFNQLTAGFDIIFKF